MMKAERISEFSILKDLLPTDDSKVIEWEKEERQRAINEMLKRSMPYGSNGKTFDAFLCENERQKKLLDTCRKASEKIRNGSFLTLCLLGSYGIGKTHLSWAIMDDVIRNGVKTIVNKYMQKEEPKMEVFYVGMSARYNLIPELVERYQAAKSFSSKENMMDVIRHATDSDLVVLDEIGRSFNPNLEKEVLYRVFNECWLSKKSVIAVSNMKFQEFAHHLGGATMDRLKDSAVFPDLETMESFRGRK